jgi:hypothetical protein
MGTDLDDLYGNLGQDLLRTSSSFTLDLIHMRFTLGPAQPQKLDTTLKQGP